MNQRDERATCSNIVKFLHPDVIYTMTDIKSASQQSSTAQHQKSANRSRGHLDEQTEIRNQLVEKGNIQ